MELWIAIAGAIAVFLIAVAAVFFVRRNRLQAPEKKEELHKAAPAPKAQAEAEAEQTLSAPVDAEATLPVTPPPTPDLSLRLAKTRGTLFGRLGALLGRPSPASWPETEWEQLEEVLLEGDVGISTTTLLIARIKGRLNEANGRGLKDLIQEESEGLLAGLSHGLSNRDSWPKPLVISVVGVNGAGKTTTIGKLSRRLQSDGKSVLLGACDTFRAAAIQQLRVWSERAGTQFVTGREGGDPGAVAFDAVTAGKARGIDVVILDTAGRLHTKANLMEELKKVHRVVKKVIPEAPHETWLVLDGTTGQNALSQAREFKATLDLTGVIITKLDGTAKGGAILAVASELKLPIKFIGVGEAIEDLIPFEPKPFVAAILGEPARA